MPVLYTVLLVIIIFTKNKTLTGAVFPYNFDEESIIYVINQTSTPCIIIEANLVDALESFLTKPSSLQYVIVIDPEVYK